ncbi:HERV-H LTR-associating protein 1 [Echinops telfairi]|uniref:HERV-H LTR-associating protein 1 n=1 Tax=Echinops telfairi TaxID=9371 RepID=A0ABM0IDQ3_ECHTE|nr:HERV-H LTR-associating protein 1 [Echinops telfairi]
MWSFLLRGPPGRLWMGLMCLLSLWDAEIPAHSVDLSALNLAGLVNRMLSGALKGSNTFFSLLSVTSYSSFAFHKFSVAIYNISHLKNVDPATFPTRHCYCLSNRTNDLSDFTALLVDIVGNSTSYLTEIFKSTSILSVSQTNNSDCIFICVMTGKSGRNLSDFWDGAEKFPVVNYTFTSSFVGLPGPCIALRTIIFTYNTGYICYTAQNITIGASGGMAVTPKPPTVSHLRLPSPSPPRWGLGTRVSAVRVPPWTETAFSSETQETTTQGIHTPGTQTPSPTKAPAPRYPPTGDLPAMWPYIPGDEPGLVPGLQQVSRCPQPPLQEGALTAPPHPLTMQKINPCLMELCQFFQQCLCVSQRRTPSTEAMRYCLEHYSWFLKNATYVCPRVKRVAHSRTLKQRCLANICKSV